MVPSRGAPGSPLHIWVGLAAAPHDLPHALAFEPVVGIVTSPCAVVLSGIAGLYLLGRCQAALAWKRPRSMSSGERVPPAGRRSLRSRLLILPLGGALGLPRPGRSALARELRDSVVLTGSGSSGGERGEGDAIGRSSRSLSAMSSTPDDLGHEHVRPARPAGGMRTPHHLRHARAGVDSRPVRFPLPSRSSRGKEGGSDGQGHLSIGVACSPDGRPALLRNPPGGGKRRGPLWTSCWTLCGRPARAFRGATRWPPRPRGHRPRRARAPHRPSERVLALLR